MGYLSRNLFATGEAEVTDDPKAIDVALSNIGKLVALPASAKKARKRAPSAKPSSPDWPPPGLAMPAQRALASAKVTNLKQLAAKREADIASLHGMCPNGVTALRRALRAAGLSFKK